MTAANVFQGAIQSFIALFELIRRTCRVRQSANQQNSEPRGSQQFPALLRHYSARFEDGVVVWEQDWSFIHSTHASNADTHCQEPGGPGGLAASRKAHPKPVKTLKAVVQGNKSTVLEYTG